MTCYNPVRAWKGTARTVNGKRGIVFNARDAFDASAPFDLPCSQCIGCRLDYSRQWAIRCLHEAQMHEENSFLTLTYNDQHIPPSWSLQKPDMQLFFKRLRHHVGASGLRYYYGGEYGEENLRPHYHVCLFGWDPPDKRLYSERDGIHLYTSDFLEAVWGKGFCTVGELTFDSAAYVARYIMKKLTRPKNCKKCAELGHECEECKGVRQNYERMDESTGEVWTVEKEYCDMSRGGKNGRGIGASYLDRYGSEVYTHDSIIINGKEVTPPEYYIRQAPDEISERIKYARKVRAEIHAADRTLARLRVREEVKTAATRTLRRPI